jgi:hypothetical protein
VPCTFALSGRRLIATLERDYTYYHRPPLFRFDQLDLRES